MGVESKAITRARGPFGGSRKQLFVDGNDKQASSPPSLAITRPGAGRKMWGSSRKSWGIESVIERELRPHSVHPKSFRGSSAFLPPQLQTLQGRTGQHRCALAMAKSLWLLSCQKRPSLWPCLSERSRGSINFPPRGHSLVAKSCGQATKWQDRT